MNKVTMRIFTAILFLFFLLLLSAYYARLIRPLSVVELRIDLGKEKYRKLSILSKNEDVYSEINLCNYKVFWSEIPLEYMFGEYDEPAIIFVEWREGEEYFLRWIDENEFPQEYKLGPNEIAISPNKIVRRFRGVSIKVDPSAQ